MPSSALVLPSWCSPNFFLARFWLAAFVIPLGLLATGIRAAIWSPSSGFAALPALEPSVVSGFISAAIFVMALLVNGVLADFKESEKMPCELESYFTSLYAQARHGSRLKGFDAAPALSSLHGMLLAAARMLDGGGAAYDGALAAFSACEDAFMLELDSRGAVGSCAMHLTNARGRLARAHVVRESSFLLPAYTLTDGLVAVVVVLLVLTRQASEVTGFVNCFVFTSLFLFLSALVRDVDNPLDYHGDNERNLRAEVRLPPQRCGHFRASTSVDFSILFVNFGRRLRADLRARGVDVDAAAAGTPADAPPAAAAAGKPRDARGGGDAAATAAAAAAAAAAADSCAKTEFLAVVKPEVLAAVLARPQGEH
jgi:hypothetical protein